jgi:phosphate-selective porin OprO/OprP
MKFRYKLLTATAITLVALSSQPVSAATNDELQARIAKLEEELNLLKQHIKASEKATEGKIAKAKVEATAEAKKAVQLTANGVSASAVASSSQADVQFGKKGLKITSPDGEHSLSIKGYAQYDSRQFLNDKGNTGRDDILARRIRPVVEGTVAKDFSFRVMADFAGSSTRVQDAYVDYKYNDHLGIRAGKFKAPLGLERLQSASDMDFIERGLPSNLSSTRDVGVQFQGDIIPDIVEYQLGIFNGAEDNANLNNDEDDKKDLIGRIFAHPFKKSGNALEKLGVGFAASTGDREGNATKAILPTYRSLGQQSVFTYSAGTFADGTQTRFIPQGYYYYKNLGLVAEYAISKQEITNAADSVSLNHKAWQVIASYVLTGENASFKGVTPKNDFAAGKGGWGAFELIARVGSLDIDNKAFPIYANINNSITRQDSAGVGVNWYLNENVRVGLNYDVTKFDGGAFGADREDENALFSRLQLKF